MRSLERLECYMRIGCSADCGIELNPHEAYTFQQNALLNANNGAWTGPSPSADLWPGDIGGRCDNFATAGSVLGTQPGDVISAGPPVRYAGWWYDPDSIHSNEAIGFVPISHTLSDGWVSIDQRARLAPRRTIAQGTRLGTMQVMLIGATPAGLHYLRERLDNELTATDNRCGNCHGHEVQVARFCSEDFNLAQDNGLRTLYDVGSFLIDDIELDGVPCSSTTALVEITYEVGDPTMWFQTQQFALDRTPDPFDCQCRTCPDERETVTVLQQQARVTRNISLRCDGTICPIGFDASEYDADTDRVVVTRLEQFDECNCDPYRVIVRYNDADASMTWERVNPGAWPSDGSIPTDCDIEVAFAEEFVSGARSFPDNPAVDPYQVRLVYVPAVVPPATLTLPDGTVITSEPTTRLLYQPMNEVRWPAAAGTGAACGTREIPCDAPVEVCEIQYPDPDNPGQWATSPNGSGGERLVVKLDPLEVDCAGPASGSETYGTLTEVDWLLPGITGPSTGVISVTYTVESGDTLNGIAAQFGVTLAQILAENPGITNPDLIIPGQQIIIPNQGGGAAASQTGIAGTFAEMAASGCYTFAVSDASCPDWAGGEYQRVADSGSTCFNITLADNFTWTAEGWDPDADVDDFIPAGGQLCVINNSGVDCDALIPDEANVFISFDTLTWVGDGWDRGNGWPSTSTVDQYTVTQDESPRLETVTRTVLPSTVVGVPKGSSTLERRPRPASIGTFVDPLESKAYIYELTNLRASATYGIDISIHALADIDEGIRVLVTDDCAPTPVDDLDFHRCSQGIQRGLITNIPSGGRWCASPSSGVKMYHGDIVQDGDLYMDPTFGTFRPPIITGRTGIFVVVLVPCCSTDADTLDDVEILVTARAGETH